MQNKNKSTENGQKKPRVSARQDNTIITLSNGTQKTLGEIREDNRKIKAFRMALNRVMAEKKAQEAFNKLSPEEREKYLNSESILKRPPLLKEKRK